MEYISGGVTAAQGFVAGGIHCGIRKNKAKPDLAMIYSETPCNAAAVYTTNLVKGAPILVTKKNLADGKAKAVICNSGNANTCNADGAEKAEKMCRIAAEVLGIEPQDVIVASTGVIGQMLPIEPIENAAQALKDSLSPDGSSAAAAAIMTTDTIPKEVAVQTVIGGKTVKLGGISKGSGMIHPNMATMLCFLTTDCAISTAMLDRAIHKVTGNTFNMISIDGDTSTNDTFAVLANGVAGNPEIVEENEDYAAFTEALEAVCRELSKLMAGDGEGATKLLVCSVDGAEDEETAKTVAKSVICSTLFKAAMFGADANWGRVLCAIGYSGAAVDVEKIDVSFRSVKGQVDVCRNGAGIEFSEEKASEVLGEKEITILVSLHMGGESAEAYGCDLTYDYVKINGDYRT
ncbi:MAG: bifunctional glutamate N-acetyltransferase/amino-acid acetyltransferase ArgJ [Acutalibacter sp.]|uniref:Arginine biosynthesis bifunctional protein ArgJ n=1 Tax=Neglectibacter timonensis TaxID=1776382 RepID=A0ABT1RYS6_9FIRM|nr:bifunctional glutamate N-acetyltransferase/amino-acid acetyltransferase ArgJ [Neglectibacter timonensis]MCQ4839832.1 bifunctional glutamate N-acetyltransferase/amino-acid acetyltransferase ArgJ [Neglectibacter timonensis]MCQ4843540.1 bifunctional glutamate N-acetyltransferase/amino-acid acetyltransferase ArgJ [Neglectibacter timonensis]